MKITFWGTPEYSLESLKKLVKSDYEVQAVITQPDKKRSRGKKLLPSPIKEFAINNDIRVITPERIKGNESFLETLRSFNSDVFIVIAYGKILSKEILNIPKYGCWNAHASILPRWRGAAPIQWSILKGDPFTGVGIMKMEEGLDTGDILFEEKIKIVENENLKTLSKKLSILSSELIFKALSFISNNPNAINSRLTPQNATDLEIKYARMIRKEDYKLDFNDSAINIERKVRGLYPKAFIKYKNKNLKIIKIRLINNKELDELNIDKERINKDESSKVLKIYKNEGVVISTNTTPIVILEIKLEGKNASSNNQLIQQLNLKIGDKI